jgi:hypothetical protein
MATIPTPYTWAHEEIPDFREMEARLTDMVQFLMNPPMIRLRKVAQQNISNATNTALAYDYVEVETENMWDSANPSKVTPITPGWYAGTYGASFVSNVTGYRQLDAIKNGSANPTMRMKYDPVTGPSVGRGISFLEQFNGTTDYLEVYIYQNSGGSLLTATGSMQYYPDLALRWIAPL